MEYDKITVTADGEHIVGWQDGTTAARILWMAAGQVNGRWVNRESSAIALLYTLTGSATRPLVGAELLPVDEVAYYSATVGTPAQQKEFNACNRDIVARYQSPNGPMPTSTN